MTQAIERARNEALAIRDQAAIIEQVIGKGDLAQLTPDERVTYYREVCRSLGLNELTQPFGYIVLQGKTTLYPLKGCTDQLRKINHVNITKIEREEIGDLYVVTAYATCGDRTDSEIGAVNVSGLRGEALANAMMKATTKAKRRVTLSICGLGWTDESEIDSIPGARTIVVDSATGEVLEERHNNTDLVTTSDDRLWSRWQAIKDEAQSLGVPVDNLRLPIARTLLVDTGLSVRRAIDERKQQLANDDAQRAHGANEHQTRAAAPSAAQARSGRAAQDSPSSAAPLEEDRTISSKTDPLWREWLATEADARKADLDLDTSTVRLGCSESSLRASIDTLREAITGATSNAATP